MCNVNLSRVFHTWSTCTWESLTMHFFFLEIKKKKTSVAWKVELTHEVNDDQQPVAQKLPTSMPLLLKQNSN